MDEIVNNKRDLKDVGKLSHHYQKSSLEAIDSAFSFHGNVVEVILWTFNFMDCNMYNNY